MAKQIINLGSAVGAGDGESLRDAFQKANENFDEVYALSEANDLSSVSQNIIPSANEVYNLGSPTRKFKDLYLSGNTIYLGEGQISIGQDGTIEFSGDVRQVELIQKDIVGDVFSEDSTLVINGGTGHVLNLGGEAPEYYLDYNNFINAPNFSFNELADQPGLDGILAIGNTTTRNLTANDITANGQFIGNGVDGITNITDVTSLAGDLNNFSNIAGTGPGNISGYTNIVGSSTGEIIGFTNITTSTKMTIGDTEWNASDIANWNEAYGWGNHAAQGYATTTYVDQEVSNAVLGTGFADTAYVNLAINQLKNNAPTSLDTLGELAAAIENDPLFYQTVNSKLDQKLSVDDFQGQFNYYIVRSSTDLIPEGTSNKYFTDERVDDRVASLLVAGNNTTITYNDVDGAIVIDTIEDDLSNNTTDDLLEGENNLYYTDERVDTLLGTKGYATETYVDTAISDVLDAAPEALDTLNELAAALGDDPNFATTISNGLAQKFNTADFDSSFDSRFGLKTTDELPQGTLNLYFTDENARNAISGDGDITFNQTTGVISFNNTSGYLTTVTFADVDETAYVTSTDSWINDADDKIATTAAIEARVITEDLDSITSRNGGVTSNNIQVGAVTASSGILDTLSVNTVSSDNDHIDFDNKEIRNVTFDFGSYGGS